MTVPTCFIVGAAPAQLPTIEKRPSDLLIAADGGLDACRAAGLVPDLIVGDFDSLGAVPAGDNVVTLPVEKDDTDTAHALTLAQARGFRRFVLFGALGGERIDHSFANFALAASAAKAGCRCFLVGDRTIVTAIHNGECRFPAGMQGDVSVFPFGGKAKGVTEEGLKYTLCRADLAGDCALGVSNAFTGDAARIAVEDGTLLIFYRGEYGALY
ncbi:MAG: thiamine diphosphokinase [Oscillospiraceae bacterium]|nr:thiamine diphosphokinase [Oscillospiraceae bacterium]